MWYHRNVTVINGLNLDFQWISTALMCYCLHFSNWLNKKIYVKYFVSLFLGEQHVGALAETHLITFIAPAEMFCWFFLHNVHKRLSSSRGLSSLRSIMNKLSFFPPYLSFCAPSPSSSPSPSPIPSLPLLKPRHLWVVNFTSSCVVTWRRHQIETFSALLAFLCAGNSPITGEFPSQRPVTRSFDGFFYLRLNKRLIKQSWGWWFETPSRSLWHHCNELIFILHACMVCQLTLILKAMFERKMR